MADPNGNDIRVERLVGRSIVSLKVSKNALDRARDKLQLADELKFSGNDLRSLWFGPDRWLLVSGTTPVEAIIESCSRALSGITHNAVDYSSGLAMFRVSGNRAKDILASGTGVDLRPHRFPVGTCCRARLAQIPAIVTAEGADSYDVYVDRNYGTYMAQWLDEAASICLSRLNAP